MVIMKYIMQSLKFITKKKYRVRIFDDTDHVSEYIDSNEFSSNIAYDQNRFFRQGDTDRNLDMYDGKQKIQFG